MVHGLFLCFAEGWGNHARSTVAMASGEGTGGRSLPTGQGVLGRDRHGACCLLDETLLGTPLRGVFRRRERGTVAHVITFVDDVAVHVPSLNAWDQFVWPPSVAMPWATMEVEQYGYHCGQAVDLSPIMPMTQFRVTDEVGTYLCVVRALVFEGSILAYNPTRDEAEWIPACSIANNLSWVEEKSAVALANYVPHISQEAAHIAGLGAHCLVSWPDDSSSQEHEEEQEENEQEEDEQEKGDEHEDTEEQGEAGPKLMSSGVAL